MEKRYYSLSEVAKLTGLSHPRVHKLAKDGHIKKVIPPGNVKRGVYTCESVDAFVVRLQEFHGVPA